MDCGCQLFHEDELPKRLKNNETKQLKKVSVRDRVNIACLMKKSNIQSNKMSARVTNIGEKRGNKVKYMQGESIKKSHIDFVPKLAVVKSQDRLTHYKNRVSQLYQPPRLGSPQNIYQPTALKRSIQNVSQKNKIRPKIMVVTAPRLTAQSKDLDSPYLLRYPSTNCESTWQNQPPSPKQFQLAHKRSATSCLASPRTITDRVSPISSLQQYIAEPTRIIEASRDLHRDFEQSELSMTQYLQVGQQKLSNLFPKFAVSRKDTQYVNDESILSGFSQVIYVHSKKLENQEASETSPHSIQL